VIGGDVRFSSLRIKNFRAVDTFEISDLTDFIVIAGPNGCGKSCVLDAIRLLKSVYGGYQANEWMQWFGEFQIDLNDRVQLRRLFRDVAQPLSIAATVQLSNDEIEYLTLNAEKAVEPLVWSQLTNESLDRYNFSATALATKYRQYGQQVSDETARRSAELRAALREPAFNIALTINADDGPLGVESNPTMELVFQTFDPDHLGIIDYHSASRSYQREAVGGVNLDSASIEAQRRQQSLYNWQQKYSNVKTELVTTYLRELVSKEAGSEIAVSDLNATLKELFQVFFPDKEYLGVTPGPDGKLSFPVRVKSGQVHDINELSSGEKEVLYGYLRLRNSTPRHSTILLDEPELHLNPGLLEGFPDFYHRHLGAAMGNQLWLVTHSDTLLRRAVGNSSFSVFHMTSAATEASGTNQALGIKADDELHQAVIDLVGDLATYRPEAKVILFEGGGDTEVDVWMTGRLFPEFSRAVNLVSGGGKRRVRDLYEVLASTAERVGLAKRFFAITDKDTDVVSAPDASARQLQWNVYHIENFLLVPEYVRRVTAGLSQATSMTTDEIVSDALREAAETLLPSLVLERVQKEVNSQIVQAIRISGDPNAADVATAIEPSIVGSYKRLDIVRTSVTDPAYLRGRVAALEAELRAWLLGDEWLAEFPGRRILQRYIEKQVPSGAANYEGFRNLIVQQMIDDGYEPPGMKAVLDVIAAAST
jgi:hypothetical protein